LSRVFELHDAFGEPQPGDYFWEFESSIERLPLKLAAFERLEYQLTALDAQAWDDIRSRALPELRSRRPGRGWQSLFDVLNEAKAFRYLKELGAAKVRFVPRTSQKTPDLECELDGEPVLCEVKTINISEVEAEHRRRVSEGHIEATSVAACVRDELLIKISTTLQAARLQLEVHDASGVARHVIFFVIHFDDWVGDYQGEYLAQIDASLSTELVPGLEVVVCPASNLFARAFTMTAATVWEA
jgi:hypothetical protein